MVILILIGYLFLDKVDALPSLEKVAKALDKVTLFFVILIRSIGFLLFSKTTAGNPGLRSMGPDS